MNGYVNNGNDTLVGIAKDEDECGRMVNQQVPLASGATYAKHNKTCWAGTSESIHLSSGFRACLLNGLCNCSLPKYFETESTIHDIRYRQYATIFQHQSRSCIAMSKH